MKIILKISLVLLLILFLLYSYAYIFVSLKGKDIISEKLSKLLEKEVSLGSVGLRAPLVLQIRDLKIDDLVNVKYISVAPSVVGFLTGKIIFNQVKVLNPEINLIKTLPLEKTIATDLSALPTVKALAQTKQTLRAPQRESQRQSVVIIKRLLLQDGTIYFTDRTVPPLAIEASLERISLNVENFYVFPKSIVKNFRLNAEIPWQGELKQGRISASGWMDFDKKDMEVVLELEGIDAVAFH
ncbi:DUF748 domain-containing protein, partial [Candidatus Omnitrophota bacterium]